MEIPGFEYEVRRARAGLKGGGGGEAEDVGG